MLEGRSEQKFGDSKKWIKSKTARNSTGSESTVQITFSSLPEPYSSVPRHGHLHMDRHTDTEPPSYPHKAMLKCWKDEKWKDPRSPTLGLLGRLHDIHQAWPRPLWGCVCQGDSSVSIRLHVVWFWLSTQAATNNSSFFCAYWPLFPSKGRITFFWVPAAPVSYSHQCMQQKWHQHLKNLESSIICLLNPIWLEKHLHYTTRKWETIWIEVHLLQECLRCFDFFKTHGLHLKQSGMIVFVLERDTAECWPVCVHPAPGNILSFKPGLGRALKYFFVFRTMPMMLCSESESQHLS